MPNYPATTYEDAIAVGMRPAEMSAVLDTVALTSGATSLAAFGANTAGAQDATDALELLDEAIGTQGIGLIPPGTYLVNSNLTLNGSYQFAKGAKLKPANGVTITLYGSILAGLYQIFDCSAGGTIAVGVTDHKTADIEMNPVWFGADQGTSANDGTVAFQKCFASGAPRYWIPRGSYDVSDEIEIPATFGRPIVRGDGPESVINFNPNADNLALFVGTEGDNWCFQHFAINNNNSGNRDGISGFRFDNDQISALAFEFVYISAFTKYGIWLSGAQYLKVDACRIQGMRSLVATPAEGIRVDTFLNAGVISRTRFTQNDKDIRVATTTNSNALTIRDCSFERSGDTADAPYPIAGATIDRIIELEGLSALDWSGNYVEAPVPGGANAFLYLLNCIAYQLGPSLWSGEWEAVAVTTRMINIAGGRGGRVVSGRFFQIVDAFVTVDSSSSPIRMQDCTFEDGGADIDDYEAVMALMDGAAKGKLEFNNLCVETGWNPGDLANGAGETSAAVTMTGAELGDQIDASLDQDLQGMLLTAYVSAADTVRARLQNGTGGNVNLAAAVLRTQLRKRNS